MAVNGGNGRVYRRLELAGIAASLAMLAYAFAVLRPWSPVTPLANDFISFWMAGALVHEGAGSALYDVGLQQAFQTDLRLEVASLDGAAQQPSFLFPYLNPPALAPLLVPLGMLPLSWAWLLWSGLNLLAVAVAVALPLKGTPRAVAVAVVLLTFPAVPDSLLWGQMVGTLLLAVALGLLALVSGRPFLGGVLLGVLWLKPQYAVLFALLFLVKRRWRELAGMAVAGFVVAALSLLVVGFEGIASYLELLRRIGDSNPAADFQVKPSAMVNWRSLITHLWPGIPASTGSFLVLVLGVATVLAALLAWRGPWEPTSPRFLRQMLVVVLATLVASPHSHFHGAALLLAPAALAQAKPAKALPLDAAWPPMLALGCSLGLLIWPVRSLSWAMAASFLLAMALLILQCRAYNSEETGGMQR
ncbi:MAG: glycosyltransferase family 87 protein [Chloroflexota bacterium]